MPLVADGATCLPVPGVLALRGPLSALSYFFIVDSTSTVPLNRGDSAPMALYYLLELHGSLGGRERAENSSSLLAGLFQLATDRGGDGAPGVPVGEEA